ncbi:MAG: GGDEF domain-containing protein [Candidatus Omnitrophota bacterium]|nr:GGDEF domain-containing protein [Candidatus Omnitrophota bacterium]
MLYLGILILSGLFASLAVKKALKEGLLKKEQRIKKLEFEYAELNAEKSKFIGINRGLEGSLNETIVLYNLTKDICKSLDEEKIFIIFKERINDYLKVRDCRLLAKDADLSLYQGQVIFPLVIQQETLGYLAASDILEQDQEKFRILAQQFLIGAKRAHLYKRMQELSITDSLTGLFSRRHFLDRFKEELRRSKKFKYMFSFLMVDIDKFKTFNDKYGHLTGDAILREVAKTVKETIRQIDFVGRYGGEELSVILVETNKEQACFAAERIRRAIESKDIKVYDEELKVTVSIGIATFSDDGATLDELIEGADKALYMAKEAGRNRVKYLS